MSHSPAADAAIQAFAAAGARMNGRLLQNDADRNSDGG
jgi:hypothetical protein